MAGLLRQLSRKKSDDPEELKDYKPEKYPATYSSYTIFGLIGRGAFANVYAGICPSKQSSKVAIKVINFESDYYNDENNKNDPLIEIQKEASIMASLRHKNIVHSLTSFVVKNELWLVMPYLSAGSCADIIETQAKYKNGIKNENILSIIFKDILLGINYCHNDNRIHRDIKARNILLTKDGIAKLSDFGVSGALVENGLRLKGRNTLTGTPCWMAPEVVKHEKYNHKADIWSLGITALELAFGVTPYTKCKSPMQVMIAIMEKEEPRVDNMGKNKFSKNFKHFISKCLIRDINKRSSASDLLDTKWIKNVKDSFRNEFVNEILKSMIKIKSIENIKNKELPPSIIELNKKLEDNDSDKIDKVDSPKKSKFTITEIEDEDDGEEEFSFSYDDGNGNNHIDEPKKSRFVVSEE